LPNYNPSLSTQKIVFLVQEENDTLTIQSIARSARSRSPFGIQREVGTVPVTLPGAAHTDVAISRTSLRKGDREETFNHDEGAIAARSTNQNILKCRRFSFESELERVQDLQFWQHVK
jgi:hypothetical protein